MAGAVVPKTVAGKAIEEAERTTLGALPTPSSATVWGEPVASSATVNTALRLPAVAGVKPAEREQLAPAGRAVPQAVASEKELGSRPPIEIARPLSDALPGLERVTVWVGAELPTLAAWKLSELEVSKAWGAGGVPDEPVRGTT